MKKQRFTGKTADIRSVVAEGGEVRITAAAGVDVCVDASATTVVKLGTGADLGELVALETEAALVLAEIVAAGVQRGVAATQGGDSNEGLREGSVVGSGHPTGFESRADLEKAMRTNDWTGLTDRELREGAVVDAVSNYGIPLYGTDEWPETEVAEAIRLNDFITIPNAEYAYLIATKRKYEALTTPASVASSSIETPVDRNDDGGPVDPELDIDALVAATVPGAKASVMSSVGYDRSDFSINYGDAHLTVSGRPGDVQRLVQMAYGGVDYGQAA